MQTRRRRPRSTGAGFVFSAWHSGFDRLGSGRLGQVAQSASQRYGRLPGLSLSGKAESPPFPVQDAAIAAGYEGATGLSRLETDRQRPGRGRYWLRRSLSRGGVDYGIESLLKSPTEG